MPDWYVKRNSEGNPYPYSVRLGGCEYSLTEVEWEIFASGVGAVFEGAMNYCESEDYQDLVISSGTDKRSLNDIMGQKPIEPMKRRI